MPWTPELFTAPALQRILDRRRVEALAHVPYFDGFLTAEPEALIESFTGEPLLYDPVRGRVKGVAAFRAYFAWMHGWLGDQQIAVEDVSRAVLDQGGFEEVVLRFDGAAGPVALPVATVTQRATDGRIEEVRVYHSARPLIGRPARRPPLLQPDGELRGPVVVAEYERALAAGDVDAVVAAFDADGYARDAAVAEPPHRGRDGLRRFYGDLLASGGIVREDCSVGWDGDACALEYNLVRWGGERVLPEAGMAVYVCGPSGRLSAVRIYHDLEPPDTAD